MEERSGEPAPRGCCSEREGASAVVVAASQVIPSWGSGDGVPERVEEVVAVDGEAARSMRRWGGTYSEEAVSGRGDGVRMCRANGGEAG